MKSLLRQPWVISTLATIFSGYLAFAYATKRWTVEGDERARSVKDNLGTGAIMCFWHARIPMSPPTWAATEKKRIYALVSRSADGEFITQTVARLGFPSIRGSRANEDSVGEKGGSAAFREMVRWIKAGNAMAITPDGPKGPPLIMTEGVPTLARTTGAQVLLVGMASRPCIRFKSWDTTVLPLPFGRGAIVWDGPFAAGRDDDLGAQAEDWGARLRAVTDRAEQILS